MSAHRSVTLARSLTNATDVLHCGQRHEAHGEFTAALTCYDDALATLRTRSLDDVETRRALGVAWMNRGNVLQKIAASPRTDEHASIATAIAAYDEALALFHTLPPAVAAYRNHLGAAWLNRGHTLLGCDDAAAARSFEQAIATLAALPLAENPAYRLNLAGAWANLAHLEIAAAPTRARASAARALDLVLAPAAENLACAEMSLRARRALVMALGELLRAAETARQPIDALATEATDAVDDGLLLARQWESRGCTQLRPLVLRLFRLGAQIYRLHQPQFLAEFLLENLAPGAFAGDPEFDAAAAESLAQALADLSGPQLLLSGTPTTERLLATTRALHAARLKLSALNSQLATSSA